MIPAGRLDRDRPAPATPLVDRSAQLSELDERRRSAKAAIDALLARWDGAGGSEADSTPEWEMAAMDAIDSLSALLAELDLARHHVRLISQRSGS